MLYNKKNTPILSFRLMLFIGSNIQFILNLVIILFSLILSFTLNVAHAGNIQPKSIVELPIIYNDDAKPLVAHTESTFGDQKAFFTSLPLSALKRYALLDQQRSLHEGLSMITLYRVFGDQLAYADYVENILGTETIKIRIPSAKFQNYTLIQYEEYLRNHINKKYPPLVKIQGSWYFFEWIRNTNSFKIFELIDLAHMLDYIVEVYRANAQGSFLKDALHTSNITDLNSMGEMLVSWEGTDTDGEIALYPSTGDVVYILKNYDSFNLADYKNYAESLLSRERTIIDHLKIKRHIPIILNGFEHNKLVWQTLDGCDIGDWEAFTSETIDKKSTKRVFHKSDIMLPDTTDIVRKLLNKQPIGKGLLIPLETLQGSTAQQQRINPDMSLQIVKATIIRIYKCLPPPFKM